MKFYASKRRQAPAVIIISLIDILIVLLIFMMVTTSFKQQPAVKLALPESTQAKPGTPQQTNVLDNAVISVAKQTPFLYLDARPVTPEQLEAELTARVARNPAFVVAIRADTEAPFGQIVKVMDIAKAAKISTAINAYAKKPEK